MKKYAVLVIIGTVTLGVYKFARLLQSGSDGAWLVLGVMSTLALYLIFSAVDLVKDRLRAKWAQMDTVNGAMRQHLGELYEISRAQGQQLTNQQRIARLGPGPDTRDDLLTYEDALTGEVLEFPNFNDDVTQ